MLRVFLLRMIARKLVPLALCLALLLPASCGFRFWPWGKADEQEQSDQNPPPLSGQSAPGSQKSAEDGPGMRSGKQPSEAEAAYAKARALWQRSAAGEVCADPQQAVALLDRAISIAPKYGEAYVRRGLAVSEMGDFEEAFEDVTVGIRLAPTPEAYAYRGLILLRGRQPKAARRDFEYSLSKAPSQHLAHNLLGVLALSEENAKEACRFFANGCSNGDCFFLEAAKREGICK